MLAIYTAVFGAFVATGVAATILVFVFELTHAKWWLEFRGPLVTCARTIALAPIGFVPIAIWGHPPLVRSAICLVAWVAIALGISRLRWLAGPGIILLAFTLTFAASDWLHWESDVSGVYLFAGGFCASLAITAIAARARGVKASGSTHALGKLLLCAVIFWAYLAYFNLLLVWLPDLPREVGFYVVRAHGGWVAADIALGLGHFLIPFLALLFRRWNRSPNALAGIGALVLAACVLDLVWVVVP